MRTCRRRDWSTTTSSTASAARRCERWVLSAALLPGGLDACAGLRIGRAEVRDRALDDLVARHLREAARDVLHQALPRVLLHHAVEHPGLHEVVVAGPANRRIAARGAVA